MPLNDKQLAKAQSNLKRLPTTGRTNLTKKDFVAALAHELREKLSEGVTLNELWAEINSTLPSADQIKESSFRRYWQLAVKSSGIEPIKKWKRKSTQSQAIRATYTKITESIHEAKTASGFREKKDDL